MLKLNIYIQDLFYKLSTIATRINLELQLIMDYSTVVPLGGSLVSFLLGIFGSTVNSRLASFDAST
jgi:hypothetical protein